MDNGIILFVEGDTDKQFYGALLSKLHEKCEGKFPVKIIPKNIAGVGNYKSKVNRIYNNDIKIRNPDVQFTVFLCYDTDCFEYSKKPPIDWRNVEKLLIASGIQKVIHIKAKKSIEDWFLKDIDGVLKFLRLNKHQKANGRNGQEILKALFKKANKTYIKGNDCKGFIESLNMCKIIDEIFEEIKPLCEFLNIKNL